MSTPAPYPPYRKFSTDELMEMVDLFNVSPKGLAEIRAVLEREPTAPDANLFRYYNQRSKVAQLEQEFAAHLGCKYALGVNSGTSALIAALVAIGVGPGDEVIVPGYTFFASTSAIVVAKGIPVITEIDESLTLDPAAVEKAITPRTKAIIVVHMKGYPARMDVLREIADRHNVKLIEDVAQAAGGKYKGRSLGTWGHMGCFSFDAFKVMATGEGGMITTDDEWLYTRAQSWHDTAACWRPNRYARERQAGELFCGENYRMSEMSGAIGLAQLRKIDSVNENTRRIYRQIRKEVTLPKGMRWIEPLDREGLCGYAPAVLFDSVELAAKTATCGVDIRGLAGKGAQTEVRDWHVYWFWEHVLEQKTPTDEGCPFKCPHVKSLPAYSRDMCPRTKDIMLRTGFMKVQPTMTTQYISQFCREVNAGLRKIAD